MNELMTARKMFGKWYVDFRHERKRIRRPSPENSKKGAQAYERVLRSKLARGENIFREQKKKDELLYSQFFENWFADYVLSNNSLAEQKSKRSVYKNYLGPFFGKMPLCAITARDVERFKSWVLSQGIKKKTLNNYLTILRRSLKSALEWELISNVPIIRPVKAPESKWDYLTSAEAEQLIQAPGELMTRTMVRLALRTGMRLGELSGLKWEDVDMSNQVIAVRRSYARKVEKSTKNYQTRHIPMTNDLIEMLTRLERKQEIVFHNKHGKHIEHKYALSLLTRQCKRVGIRRVTWHVLRHTFASLLAQNGVPLFTVQQLLGHSTIRMTEKYAHFGTTVHHQAVATLIHQKLPRFGQYMGSQHEKAFMQHETANRNLLNSSDVSRFSK